MPGGCGLPSMASPNTYVLGLEVVLPDGALITLGSKCIKDVAGYSMTELFVGSEGTFGIITKGHCPTGDPTGNRLNPGNML